MQALIEDGTDDGSRAKVQSLQGPACSNELWTKIQEFAHGLGHLQQPTSTCSPQHATPDADASAPGHQIKGLSKWTRLRCDRGTTARVQAASVGIVSAVYTRYQTVWPIPWSDGLARTGPKGYSRCLQISRPAILSLCGRKQ